MRILLAIVLIVFASSCKEVLDTERPVADIIQPLSDSTISTGDGLHLMASLSDDNALLQFKAVIAGIDSLNDVGADSTLTMTIIDGITDLPSTFELDRTIFLPDSTFNGHYQLLLSCIDADGNESMKDTVNFSISNSIDHVAPLLDVIGPNADETLGLGQGFSLLGTITDEQSLIYADVHIGKTDNSSSIYDFGFPEVTDNTVDLGGLGIYFQVDSTWQQGDYQLKATAWDNYSGASQTIPFHVSY